MKTKRPATEEEVEATKQHQVAWMEAQKCYGTHDEIVAEVDRMIAEGTNTKPALADQHIWLFIILRCASKGTARSVMAYPYLKE